jgi:hypothetical protein
MNPVAPRPWFLSITAVWSHAEGFANLRSALLDSARLPDVLPAHHVLVRESGWHSTVFAVLRINGWDASTGTAEEHALRLLEGLQGQGAIVERLRKAFTPIRVEAHQVTCYDAGVSVQLRATDDALAAFRAQAWTILREPVLALCDVENATEHGESFRAKHGRCAVEPLLLDPNKNGGSNAFGSVARSPIQEEAMVVRWRRSIRPVQLEFPHIYLLHSDAAMTNPLAIERGVVLRYAR